MLNSRTIWYNMDCQQMKSKKFLFATCLFFGTVLTVILHHMYKVSGVPELSYRNTWKTRYDRLKEGCRIKKSYKLKYTQSSSLFLNSKKLKMTVCKLPKAGSTYMSIAFLAVEGILSVDEGFQTHRLEIHKKVKKITSKRPLWGAKAVVISRNPYSRLFSAFNDKYFMLQRPDLAAKLANEAGKGFYMTEAGKCGYNISFENFLTMVSERGLHGKRIDPHWTPIYIDCRLCATNYTYIIHQESMAEDMKHLFKEINMNRRTKNTLEKLLHTDLVDSLKGYIQAMWGDLPRKPKKPCCDNKKALFIKLWQGLQIQGFIPISVSFPLNHFPNDSLLSEKVVTDFVMDTIRNYPISAVERKAQRQKALVEAYRSVSKETIRKIQRMFEIDFSAFGYSENPPS